MRKEETSVQPTALLPEEHRCSHFTAECLTPYMQIPGVTSHRGLPKPTVVVFKQNMSFSFSIKLRLCYVCLVNTGHPLL